MSLETSGKEHENLEENPDFLALSKLLDEAGVVLSPTDRDLAPVDHRNDENIPFESHSTTT